MEAYIVDWLNLLGRWLHFVVGIAWIGSSFYFVWLDNHMTMPASEKDRERGFGGELWSVHGGSFYRAYKYQVAPPGLPETLHWFKWEAYTTWLSGMFLLVLIYWYGAEIYLIDPQVASLSQPAAIGIGFGFIVVGWLIYDGLCRSPIGRNQSLLSGIIFTLLAISAWGLCELFSGRGAYMHYGALLGTIMVANVFFVIIPGQKRMVAATAEGQPANAEDGIRAKQRSVHNTYFTLPLLFIMVSNHYAMTYGHAWNWLILIGFTLAGALIRVYFVARHRGQASPLPVIIALALLAGIAWLAAPQARATAVTGTAAPASFADVVTIMQNRCVSCHADSPTFAGFVAAPAGVVLELPEQIVTDAARIHQQSVTTKIMPVGNLTGMLETERNLIDQWFRDGATLDWVQQH